MKPHEFVGTLLLGVMIGTAFVVWISDRECERRGFKEWNPKGCYNKTVDYI